MAVPEQIPLVDYVADGTVKKFDVPFDYDMQEDLHLFVDDIAPTIDKYFFQDNAFNFYIAPTTGQKVRIERITPKRRDTDYDLHTNTIRPKALNNDFDRIWFAIQESYEDFGELSIQLQNEIIARIQSDDEILAKLAEETADRILGDAAVSNDLKNYVNEVVGAIIGDPDFQGIGADKVIDGNQTQDQINLYGGKRYNMPVGGYPLDARVLLDSGDIVQSTVPNNTNDPNVDMTGWVFDKTHKTVKTMADLRSLSNLENGDLVLVESYYPANYGLLNPVDGRGFFLWDAESTLTPVNGIVEQVTGVITGRFKRIIEDGVVNVLYCGAKRDGVTETHTELKIALQYAINNNMQSYAPTGTYLIGGRVDPTFSNGKSLYFYGDGSEYTIFKERDGLTLELGRFNMTFYFLCPDNTTVNTMSIKGMRVNKNGVTSPASSPTDYEYEQAHCFGLASSWTNSRVKNLIVDDVVTEDKIGAGICLTQGYFDTVRISNIQGVNYQHIGGQRGDFEFQAVVSDLEVDTGIGKYAQCEPNMLAAPAGYKPKARFTNCSYDITEFTAYVNTPDAQTIILDNHTAKDLCLIRWAKLIATNSTLRVYSSGNNYWEGTAKGSVITDSEIIIGVNTTTNAFDPFYPRSAANIPTYLKFKGGKFTADSTANPTTTGFAVNNGAVYSGAQGYLVEFEGVEFSSAFERTARCYANGNFTFKRCKLAGRAGSLAALEIGGYSTYYANVELESNDLSQLGGAYVQYTSSNTLCSVNYKGVHDFAKAGFTTSNAANTETCAKADGYFTSDTVPTGKGILGWKVKINKPAFGTGSEFICTTTSSTSAVYQLSLQAGVKMDTTANRPSSLTSASRGLRYLDTTLAVGGKPIQYNGSAWADSLGAVV